MKKRPGFDLFIWGSSEPYWGGWQGYAGLYKTKDMALDRLDYEKNRQNHKAQLVDHATLRVVATYEKRDGKWSEVRNGK